MSFLVEELVHDYTAAWCPARIHRDKARAPPPPQRILAKPGQRRRIDTGRPRFVTVRMRSKVAVIAVLGSGALALAALVLWPRPEGRASARGEPAGAAPRESRKERELKEKMTERKRVRPSTHRASPAELAVRNRVAAAEAAKAQARAALAKQFALPSVPARTWVPLGPTDASREYNGVEIDGVDSGRPNSIVVDPRDPNVVYLAVSGGGVWKTFDFLAQGGPTWMPLTDTQPNLAIGGLAIDGANPDVLYLATGDAFDISGNTIQKSADGGATWSAPVELAGTYPAPNNFDAAVGDIRTIAVQGATVLAGTNVGLFRSTDGGATFALVDLPNPSGRVLTESVWSVVHTGGGQWVASGLTGCDVTSGPPPTAFGADPGPACPAGNNGAIWRSNDGAAWTQMTTPSATGTGRITLAAGGTADPAATAVYAYVGAVDGFATAGFWRSLDGGRTWANATGTLANPTTQYQTGPGQFTRDCGSIDLGHDQTWYNEAIAVDPTNPNNVLVGGNLCGARTRNGTAAQPTWELVSHWLPGFDPIGTTVNGRLDYVHADWHTAAIAVVNGQVRAFAGTDGGLFSSTNLFASAQAEQVSWTHHNRGLATHLVYAVASGDPATQDPFVLFGGLQDNGTRFRTRPASPTVFNQAVGGDGIGATVHASTSGTTYWASVQFGRVFCKPAQANCADGESWQDLAPVLNNPVEDGEEELRKDRDYALGRAQSNDSEPFFVHYANVETDTTGQSVLTHSTGQVFVAVAGAGGALSWRAISQDLTPQQRAFNNVAASRTIPGLYGAAGNTSAAPFYVSTTGNTPSTWAVAQPVRPTGTTARLTGPSSIDFPPVQPAGTVKGQVYVGAFVGTMNDGSALPDDKGRLWRTTDFGQTWRSLAGADPARRLPNVPVHVVKYDPVTPTTLYAGTDVGVYLSLDDGATWDRMGDGFPVVPVRDLYVARNQEFIRVATYGRGFWEIYPSAGAHQGVPGNGDYDRNLRLDWIDLAAMSSRLGVTPATPAAPFYTWLLDITGGGGDPPLQAIDGADLDALLAKLGGHP